VKIVKSAESEEIGGVSATEDDGRQEENAERTRDAASEVWQLRSS